jgi:prepilin-type N-terminal cleavage/methylation domain-containing protein
MRGKVNSTIKPNYRRSAFTLIELIVVVAIIATLAAILFPVFSKAKARAFDAETLTSLRQLAAAQELYSADNDSSTKPHMFSVKLLAETRYFGKTLLTVIGDEMKDGYGNAYYERMHQQRADFRFSYADASPFHTYIEEALEGKHRGAGWALAFAHTSDEADHHLPQYPARFNRLRFDGSAVPGVWNGRTKEGWTCVTFPGMFLDDVAERENAKCRN